MANGTVMASAPFVQPTANDRLKEGFGNWFWGGIAAAALLHFAVMALWPNMEAADVSVAGRELEQIEVVQEIEIPPPPEQIVRPAIPVMNPDLNLAEDITIGEVTFDENPVNELPPPPSGRGVDLSAQPAFTPREVEPELRNRTEFGRALERVYPPMMKDAGIGGRVVLWVFVTESGEVGNIRVHESSGYEQLDQAAEKAMRETARFSPALNREQRVPVWIALPVTFQTTNN
jgi:periplasmic protein TonB